jgi:hypothetical protein
MVPRRGHETSGMKRLGSGELRHGSIAMANGTLRCVSVPLWRSTARHCDIIVGLNGSAPGAAIIRLVFLRHIVQRPLHPRGLPALQGVWLVNRAVNAGSIAVTMLDAIDEACRKLAPAMPPRRLIGMDVVCGVSVLQEGKNTAGGGDTTTSDSQSSMSAIAERDLREPEGLGRLDAWLPALLGVRNLVLRNVGLSAVDKLIIRLEAVATEERLPREKCAPGLPPLQC